MNFLQSYKRTLSLFQEKIVYSFLFPLFITISNSKIQKPERGEFLEGPNDLCVPPTRECIHIHRCMCSTILYTYTRTFMHPAAIQDTPWSLPFCGLHGRILGRQHIPPIPSLTEPCKPSLKKKRIRGTGSAQFTIYKFYYILL